MCCEFFNHYEQDIPQCESFETYNHVHTEAVSATVLCVKEAFHHSPQKSSYRGSCGLNWSQIQSGVLCGSIYFNSSFLCFVMAVHLLVVYLHNVV